MKIYPAAAILKSCEDIGFRYSGRFNALFKSNKFSDIGIFLSNNSECIVVDSVDAYNAEILNLSCEIFGMRPPKSPIRRVTLGHIAPLRFVTENFSALHCWEETEILKATLKTIELQIKDSVQDLDFIFFRVDQQERIVKSEKRRYQSYVYETLIIICIIKKLYEKALEYCESYYSLTSPVTRRKGNFVFQAEIFIRSLSSI